VTRKRVLILGAGGAARAAVAACCSVGAQARVVARRHEQADALESVGRVEIFPWTRRGLMQAADGVTLIVNCTPLGMAPDVDASPWPVTLALPRAVVYDMVYNPPETRLVRMARQAERRAVTGLGMLVEQGALAFELWTGKTAPRALMRQAAEQALLSPQPPSSPTPEQPTRFARGASRGSEGAGESDKRER
jgi:shikimate dehydrogenase